MTDTGANSWFLILYSVSVLGIAVILIQIYANRFRGLKSKIHEIHALIELIDESLTDDQVTKDEFTALVKRCLSVLKELI